jgi:hypothetical protein
LKLLANFENAYTEALLRIPFSVIGSSANLSLAVQGKCAKINLSQAASTAFQYDFKESQAGSYKHFQCQIAALASLKRVIGRDFKLISNLKGAS